MLDENGHLDPFIFKRVVGLKSQLHAKNLDKRFGFKSSKIEVKLLQKYRAYYKENDSSNKKQHFEGTQTWIGLHPQALQTSYNEIFEVLNLLKDFDIKRIIDIGAGYGRVGLVMNALFPAASFIGYEILKKRANEGNRVFESLDFNNCEIHCCDVLTEGFNFPNADIYFIYDFSESSDICQILDKLINRNANENFFLITKGDRLDFLLSRKYKSFWLNNGYITCGDMKIYNSKVDLSIL